MKNKRVFMGILSFLLVFGLFLTGCGEEPTTNVTVIFDKNGADGRAPAERSVEKGSRITIPDEGELSLSGYSFDGWDTRRNGSGDRYYENDRMTVNEDTTLYAQWKQGSNNGGGDTAVTFSGVTADGSSSQTTTQLTLTFSQAITSLSANDITLSGVSGVNKGTFSGSGPTYTMGISGFTSGGTLSAAVVKSGYNISGSPKTVTIYYSGGGGDGNTTVTLDSVTANGSSSQTTTSLTLTFSQAITSLSANDITLSGVSGVTKGTLSGSGPTYTLSISGFTSGGTLSVLVSKSGYTISSTSNSTTIFYNSGGGGGSTLSAPTGVTATAQSSSSISVSWNSVSGATSYDVYYEIGTSTTKNLAGNTSNTSYTHSGLTASTTYYYYIKAKNSDGSSDYSSAAYTTTSSGGGGGGSLTVTGYRQYTDSTIGIFVLTSNPATFDEFRAAETVKSFTAPNPPTNNKYDWDGGRAEPPDGTYTVVVSTGGVGWSLASTQVYKFTNITITGGNATVPFNEVVGSSVGTNGRLK